MKKIFKLSIVISLIILLLVISNLALAQQEGKGYFLEKGNEFFIFDNLYINGYLTVGKDMLAEIGDFGDVLVSDRVFLDENASFIFCKDERQYGTNATLNRDCAAKVLIWHSRPDKGLEVVDTDFYELATNNIEAWPGSIIFQPGQDAGAADKDIFTDVPVKLIGAQGCFSNRGENCNKNELKTTKVYLRGLGLFGEEDTIRLDASHINLGEVDLGDANEFTRHKLCWLASNLASCPKKHFKHASYTEVWQRGLDRIAGPVLCCYLTVDF